MSDEMTFQELTRVPYDRPVRCIRCGREQQFATPADAHAASWDVAPYFSLQPVCRHCPYGMWVKEFFNVTMIDDE